MREKIWVVVFTILVTAVAGTLVSGFNFLLKDRKEMNGKVARQKVLLAMLGLKPADAVWPNAKILEAYAAGVTERPGKTADGRELTTFVTKEGNPDRVVFPFRGQGFWDVIHGFLAVDSRARTILGIEFTEHAETPGLGGRISEPAFKKRFAGKPADRPDEKGRRLRLVPEGNARGETEIDGITGASETSRSVDRIVNEALRDFWGSLQGGGTKP